jgi:hypothetical protein
VINEMVKEYSVQKMPVYLKKDKRYGEYMMKRVKRGSYIHARKCQGSCIKGAAGMRVKTRPVLAFEIFNSLDACEALASAFRWLIPETLLRYREVFVVGK